jgi:hypothetical protein
VKPFSEACERNREPILAILKRVFKDRKRVLEIGSGTGQHAPTSRPHCRTSSGSRAMWPITCPGSGNG